MWALAPSLAAAVNRQLAESVPCALCGGSSLIPGVSAGYHCLDGGNEEIGNSNGMWDGSGYGLATEEACAAGNGVWAAYTCQYVAGKYDQLERSAFACNSVQIMCLARGSNLWTMAGRRVAAPVVALSVAHHAS